MTPPKDEMVAACMAIYVVCYFLTIYDIILLVKYHVLPGKGLSQEPSEVVYGIPHHFNLHILISRLGKWKKPHSAAYCQIGCIVFKENGQEMCVFMFNLLETILSSFVEMLSLCILHVHFVQTYRVEIISTGFECISNTFSFVFKVAVLA